MKFDFEPSDFIKLNVLAFSYLSADPTNWKSAWKSDSSPVLMRIVLLRIVPLLSRKNSAPE